MPFDTFTPPVPQSPGTKMSPEIKTLEASFGDGYTQGSPDGVQNVREVASLNWAVLLEDQADAIYSFLKAHKGSIPFYYALRDGVVRKWTCKEFSRLWDTPNTITATFRESFIYDPPAVTPPSGGSSGTPTGLLLVMTNP
jgi:phage-related protein